MATASVMEGAVVSKDYSRQTIAVAGLCFIASGATGLIYEIVWMRLLGLVFGATTFAVSAVLAAFMGGLAFGAAIAGRKATQLRRPLAAYGVLEIGIAAYAVAVPYIFSLVDKVYGSIWTIWHPGFYTFNACRFLLSCAVLLVPTTLMGATLPILTAALRNSGRYRPGSVTRLYTFNLVGAIVGTLLAGFALLPTFGLQRTIWLAAAINVVIGIVAIIVDQRNSAPDANDLARLKRDERVEVEPGTKVDGTNDQFLWVAAAAVSGFVTISSQVAWTRLLTMIIGSSTYAFSLVVALFLIGLSLGAMFISKTGRAKSLRKLLLQVELASAAGFVASLFVLNWIPAFLVNYGLAFGVSSWTGLLVLQILAAAMLVLLPAILMGTVMPLVLLWAGDAAHASRTVRLVGRLYSVNTVGAIAGACGAAFLLIPYASTRFTILFASTLCIVVAVLAYEPSKTSKDADLRRALASGVAVVLVIALFVTTPSLNKLDLSLGAYDTLIRVLARSSFGGGQEEEGDRGPGEHRVLMYEEGPTATVSVRRDWDIVSMAVNGRTNASDKSDMPTQVILGQLPVLLAPSVKSALIVGYGSGVSVGSLLQSNVVSVECVELEPRVIDVDKHFQHVNTRPLSDSRLRLVIDDARSYLRVTPNRYDIIVSEPSHPWVPGVANLFTKEFFEMGRARLNSDGIFVQWLQIYQMSTESLQSVLATYRSVFPHVLVYRVSGASKGKDLILVGSITPVTRGVISDRIRDPKVGAELARIGIHSVGDLESWFVCDETVLDPAIKGAPINTDDNMRIENRVPREAFRPTMVQNGKWIEELSVRTRAISP